MELGLQNTSLEGEGSFWSGHPVYGSGTGHHRCHVADVSWRHEDARDQGRDYDYIHESTTMVHTGEVMQSPLNFLFFHADGNCSRESSPLLIPGLFLCVSRPSYRQTNSRCITFVRMLPACMLLFIHASLLKSSESLAG